MRWLEKIDWRWAMVANLLVLGVVAYAKVLTEWDSDLMYRSLQEDEALEWATFWAFVGAGVAALGAARRQHRQGVRVPWFLIGVGLFCLAVAMEEISWGQRLLGYRPPDYFLEHNFQQEFNLHNVTSTKLRKLGLKATILGYGVLLPCLALVPGMRRLFDRWAILPAPMELVPSFLLTFATYKIYPWRFSGELVELMLGLGFLFSLLAVSRYLARAAMETHSRRSWLLPLKATLIVIVLGIATAGVSQALTRGHPAKLELTRAETEVLRKDFLNLPEIHCDSHKRVYSYVEKYDAEDLYSGQFSSLVTQGGAEERASFFLDPWNLPYWIRHRCTDDGATKLLFVYSFGPNKKRDSTRTEILGDDIAAVSKP